ncbi:uncharacterized protein LOC119110613 isoform X1 [Pollicipes pollicipes]|uniref:uncharacterized protein LOC119110613 isoform X1 n=2 Tax=Pollicipes pollicipes TaxID=41117 RepID=UPI0018854E73|nr:uncharacterized protein LOC119110613 isoform X1 [Pollicipes pollicipes]
MLSKDEYHEVASAAGELFILCERLDIFPDVEKELLSGKTISVRCPSTEQSASEWLQMFQDMTKTTLSVLTTSPGRREHSWVLYKKRFQCQHYARKKPGKAGRTSLRDTGCAVNLTVRVRKVAFANSAKSRSKKPDAGYALKVQSNGVQHNHPKESAAVLKFRRVGEPARARLIALFEQHHTPASALHTLKAELQAEHGDNFAIVSADRAVLPDIQFVYELYRKVFYKKQISPSSTNLEFQLEDVVTDTALQTTALDRMDWSGGWLEPLAVGASVDCGPSDAGPPTDAVGRPDGAWCPETDDSADLDSCDDATGCRSSTSSEQAEAAASVQRQLDGFTRCLVQRVRTDPHWHVWASGVESFLRRWRSLTPARQVSLLRGSARGRGRGAARIGMQRAAAAPIRLTTLRD